MGLVNSGDESKSLVLKENDKAVIGELGEVDLSDKQYLDEAKIVNKVLIACLAFTLGAAIVKLYIVINHDDKANIFASLCDSLGDAVWLMFAVTMYRNATKYTDKSKYPMGTFTHGPLSGLITHVTVVGFFMAILTTALSDIIGSITSSYFNYHDSTYSTYGSVFNEGDLVQACRGRDNCQAANSFIDIFQISYYWFNGDKQALVSSESYDKAFTSSWIFLILGTGKFILFFTIRALAPKHNSVIKAAQVDNIIDGVMNFSQILVTLTMIYAVPYIGGYADAIAHGAGISLILVKLYLWFPEMLHLWKCLIFSSVSPDIAADFHYPIDTTIRDTCANLDFNTLKENHFTSVLPLGENCQTDPSILSKRLELLERSLLYTKIIFYSGEGFGVHITVNNVAQFDVFEIYYIKKQIALRCVDKSVNQVVIVSKTFN